VAASFDVESAQGGEVLERARHGGIVLQQQDEDGTTLVVYRGQRPSEPAPRPVARRLRHAVGRHVARQLGRRQPWVPFPPSAPAGTSAKKASEW